MYELMHKRVLAPNTSLFEVKAPKVALRCGPGNFVIIRIDDNGERIPLTIAGADPEAGTITLVTQATGRTTTQLVQMEVGDALHDLVGPLGNPAHLERYGTVVIVSGGYGVAAALPIVKGLRGLGNRIISIIGARNKELVIMEPEVREVSDEVVITTNDGSYGMPGMVTDALGKLLEEGRVIDFVLAIGPGVMMKAVSEMTRPYGIKTMVSLNTIMIDGTGMCGSCRVTVGGKTRFVCVDGPEFDGHQVDFDEMMHRQKMYLEEERIAYEECKHGAS